MKEIISYTGNIAVLTKPYIIWIDTVYLYVVWGYNLFYLYDETLLD